MNVLTTPAQIAYYRLCVLKARLKLEIAGMKGRGRSTYSILKQEFGFKGTKQQVLNQLEARIALCRVTDAFPGR